MFYATISVPGYLPDIEPVPFDTAKEAWEYLVTERIRDLADAFPDAITGTEHALGIMRDLALGQEPRSTDPTGVTWWRAQNWGGSVIARNYITESGSLCYMVSSD